MLFRSPGFFWCTKLSSLLVIECIYKWVPRIPIRAILSMLVVEAVCNSQYPTSLQAFNHTVVDNSGSIKRDIVLRRGLCRSIGREERFISWTVSWQHSLSVAHPLAALSGRQSLLDLMVASAPSYSIISPDPVFPLNTAG